MSDPRRRHLNNPSAAQSSIPPQPYGVPPGAGAQPPYPPFQGYASSPARDPRYASGPPPPQLPQHGQYAIPPLSVPPAPSHTSRGAPTHHVDPRRRQADTQGGDPRRNLPSSYSSTPPPPSQSPFPPASTLRDDSRWTHSPTPNPTQPPVQPLLTSQPLDIPEGDAVMEGVDIAGSGAGDVNGASNNEGKAKKRPVFCVVCASNNVSTIMSLWIANNNAESIYGSAQRS